jgi:hypothetical protein
VTVSAALAEISCYGAFFTVTVGGTDDGWHPVRQSYADGCADLIDATVARYRTTDRRIGASLVQFGHASRLWSPVLACALGYGIVPDLAGLQRADDGPRLRLPDPTGVPVDPDRPPPDLLYRVVVQEHLEPLAAGLPVKLAAGLLYGNIASALVGALQQLVSVRPDLRRPATATTYSLLATAKLAGTGVITGPDLEFRRRSCCLYYRIPDGSKCGDCALAD